MENQIGYQPTSTMVTHLLKSVDQMIRHDQELQRITGEKFNLFEILRIGHYEVAAHSPLLAELLDPKGRHGQGHLFLELFLNNLDGNKEYLPDPHTATVYQEKSLDDLGRVDILIEDRAEKTLIIENKIYASDQEDQILRYLRHPKTTCVVYLTLRGDQPTEYSFSSKAKDYLELKKRLKCVSYKADIIKWLTDCRSIVPTVAQVRESLTQYIQLVKRLTEQNSSQRMDNKITKIVTNTPEDLQAYFYLHHAYRTVIDSLVEKLNTMLQAGLTASDLKLDPLIGNTKENGFYFRSEFLKSKNLSISLFFDQNDFKECSFGVIKCDLDQEVPDASALREDIIKYIPSLNKESTLWLVWGYWREHRDWGEATWSGILDKSVPKQLLEDVTKLYEIIKTFYSTSRPLTVSDN